MDPDEFASAKFSLHGDLTNMVNICGRGRPSAWLGRKIRVGAAIGKGYEFSQNMQELNERTHPGEECRPVSSRIIYPYDGSI